MANYGDGTDLATLYYSITDSVTANMKQLALDTADAWVLTKVNSVPSPTPNKVEKAATFYAYTFILRDLFDTSLEDSVTAKLYEELALELLESYINDSGDDDEHASPYSSKLTPGNRYSKRDLRTTEYTRDYEYIDNVTWESDCE